MVLNNGTIQVGASSTGVPGSVTSGPLGAGTFLVAGASGGTPTLTSNSTTAYTIANPIILSGPASSSTGSLTLGDGSNHALTLSARETLGSIRLGYHRHQRHRSDGHDPYHARHGRDD